MELFNKKPFSLKKPGTEIPVEGIPKLDKIAIVSPEGERVQSAMTLQVAAAVITNGCDCDKKSAFKCECLIDAARSMMIGAARLVELGNTAREKTAEYAEVLKRIACLSRDCSCDCQKIASDALPKPTPGANA